MMTVKNALRFITEGKNQQLNMMFHFEHMGADCIFYSWIKTKFSLKKLKKVYTKWQEKLYGKAWNALYIENHDQPRIVNRYGSLKFRKESAKMLAVMYICQCGTPFIYQGQEIGMTNLGLEDIDAYVDVSTKNNYKIAKSILGAKKAVELAKYASRDNARTPVQWSAEKNAGFTSAQKPWFFINENYKEINVEEAENDPDSILNFYRKLLRFRKENDVVIYGSYEEFYKHSPRLYVYSRRLDNKKMLVICSFSENAAAFKAPEGFDLSKASLVLNNYNSCGDTDNKFTLRPYETRVYLWKE